MSKKTIRLGIADDHPVVRAGLLRLLEGYASEIDVVVEAEDGYSLIEKIRTNPCDVVLLDIAMPGPGITDLIQRVKSLSPDTAVLVLSAKDEQHYAIRSIKAGADGYVTKTRAGEELITAICRVAAGRKYVTDTLAERLAAAISTDATEAPHQELSTREFQVLLGLGAGKSQKQIAAEMHLSPKTVSTYRHRIMEKMGFKTTADIVRYTVANRLVE